MNLLYLGEIIQESYIKWCLDRSRKFDRINHLLKPTLDFAHISVNPVPDKILVKCDWEDHELLWVKRYAPDVPKTFLVCNQCLRKADNYISIGNIFNIEVALKNNDIFLDSLVQFIEGDTHA